MTRSNLSVLGFIALVGLAHTPDAGAQAVYRCGQSNGTVTWSDRPCTDNRLLSYGPQSDAAPSAPKAPTERMPDALPYQSFLGVDCGELAEAVRTGRGRGLSAQAIDRLRSEYRDRCSEQDADARRQYEQSLQDERQRRMAARESAQRAQVEQQRLEDQCALMKRNLNQRRSRTDLTPGEQADLQRFEATYRERCAR